MKKVFLLLLSLCVTVISFAQELNQVDAKGKKQGEWKKYFSNGELRYEGQFKDDIPYGEFVYYSPYKYVIARTVFMKDGVSYTTMFHKNGAKRAFGKNVDEKKDSVWTYYDRDGVMISQDTYIEDVKSGLSQVFYPSGKVTEEVPWVNGVKNGEWKQYYEDGQVMSVIKYVNGLVEGEAMYFHPDGKVNIKGTYQNDLPTGVWEYYDLKGELIRKVTYQNGDVIEVEGEEIGKEWQE